MTTTDKRAVTLLLAIEKLGGEGKSADVLKQIENLGESIFLELSFSQEDRVKRRKGNNKIVWENQMQHERRRLVDNGRISNAEHNCWRITNTGKEWLRTRFAHHISEGITRNELESWQNHQHVKNDLLAFAYEEGREGEIKLELLIRYERDPKLREQAIQIHGIQCKVCGFDFQKTYGDRGKHFIEVHHLTPLSKIKQEHTIDPQNDMTVLCSNCHRMVHREKEKILPIDALKRIFEFQKVIHD